MSEMSKIPVPKATNGASPSFDLPSWVPEATAHYLIHTEMGVSIRALAREADVHASTILRQIRRIETRRDDILLDAGLRKLGKYLKAGLIGDIPDTPTLMQESVRILRRLCETSAVLAVAEEMEKAIVVRDNGAGVNTRTAVVDRAIAQAMVLKEWIVASGTGRITRYQITATGRSALAEMLVDYNESSDPLAYEFAEQQSEFIGAPVVGEKPQGGRYTLAESPLSALARRREKDGKPFLEDDLVSAGERLREDFELAQMGARVAQNWEGFLGAAVTSGGGTGEDRAAAARLRMSAALAELGPGLSDVALRCCCYLEGLETTEQRLGWSARSGKIVLRIALLRLKRHYEETLGDAGGMIG